MINARQQQCGRTHTMQTRPRIGIPMRIELTTDRFYLSRHYSEAIEAAGGAPVHISLIPHADYVDSVVQALDGILLPGSDSDVIKVASAYEAATHHRVPPPSFGPLPVHASASANVPVTTANK